MTLLDTRPPGIDVLFRPGNTFTLTLTWPSGALAGRTFTAALDAQALTVDVIGDDMTIVASPAVTVAADERGVFVLTETTGGGAQAVIVGAWAGSPAASTSSSATVEISDTDGAAITVDALSDPAAVKTTGAQTVAGVKTFTSSPRVPNPADLDPGAAASVGEVEGLIAAAAAGFIRSMDPKSTLLPILDNTTSEPSMLNAVFPMPRITHEAVARVVATGVLRNVSGGSVNFTFRLRNTTDALLLCSAVVAVPNDTQARAWRFQVDIEGNTFLADGVESVGQLVVGAGASASLVQAMGQAVVSVGADPQNWDVTAQTSAAHADVEVTVYGCRVEYALPGAP